MCNGIFEFQVLSVRCSTQEVSLLMELMENLSLGIELPSFFRRVDETYEVLSCCCDPNE